MSILATLIHLQAAVVANGQITDYSWAKEQIQQFSYIVAVDGGLNHCHAMGLNPDLIVGDMDSVHPQTLAAYPHVEKMVFPRDKDKTDLEIALDYLIEQNAHEIVIFGGDGGRIDHLLGNLYLLTRFPGVVFLESPSESIFAIKNSATIPCIIGQTISLIPLNGPVHGITTHGLKWKLENGTLNKNFIGISNEAINTSITIEVEQGDLLFCLIK